MKNIPIYDLFYRVALDTVGPLPETKDEISMLWLPLTIIQSGVKQDLLGIMMLLLLQDFWKNKSYADLVCPNSFSLIMEVSGWLNLT
jgi:hypothetical protein